MLNQFVIVGEVQELHNVKEVANGVSTCTLVLNVERTYRNANGDVDIDTLKVTLWQDIAGEAINVCKIGSLVGIRGRLEANKNNEVELIAEKLSFLSSTN